MGCDICSLMVGIRDGIQYIPRNMHTVFALLCFVVVIHWLIFPYPSGLLHWHCGNLTIAPVPAKQPWWIWINTSCKFIMNDCITTTKQSTTKPCAYFLGYTVWWPALSGHCLPSTGCWQYSLNIKWLMYGLLILCVRIPMIWRLVFDVLRDLLLTSHPSRSNRVPGAITLAYSKQPWGILLVKVHWDFNTSPVTNQNENINFYFLWMNTLLIRQGLQKLSVKSSDSSGSSSWWPRRELPIPIEFYPR